MEQVYPNEWYMQISESLKQKDGTDSLYNRIMFNPSGLIMIPRTNKKEIEEYVHERLSNAIEIDKYTKTETKQGYIYERYIKWIDEEQDICVAGTPNDYDDYEKYTVSIHYYVEDIKAFSQLSY